MTKDSNTAVKGYKNAVQSIPPESATAYGRVYCLAHPYTPVQVVSTGL